MHQGDANVWSRAWNARARWIKVDTTHKARQQLCPVAFALRIPWGIRHALARLSGLHLILFSCMIISLSSNFLACLFLKALNPLRWWLQTVMRPVSWPCISIVSMRCGGKRFLKLGGLSASFFWLFVARSRAWNGRRQISSGYLSEPVCWPPAICHSHPKRLAVVEAV